MRYLWLILLGTLLCASVAHLYAAPKAEPDCREIMVPVAEDEEYEYFVLMWQCKRSLTSKS